MWRRHSCLQRRDSELLMSPCNFGVTEENGLSPLRVRKTHRGDAETQSKKDKNNFGERGGGGGNLLLPKRWRCFCRRQRHPLRRRTLPLPPPRSPNILSVRFRSEERRVGKE